ncbi:DUF2309 domain-containing protein [Planctellipticum variicoloris]|uniref:DUF2309 domain-containing protein n=1 Tax=Planctellipticum variicoloris TaxID=3064265 RepID=UPI0030141737|nr:DUF2309 domain-containing protein [Planctomycetaceae bacterium SH412]
MSTVTEPRPAKPTPSDRATLQASHLEHVIGYAANLLPIQGPITVFVALNTLQALENLPFDEGVQHGARLFDCQPYLPEQRYREALLRGRIRVEDLEAVLRQDLGSDADQHVFDDESRFDLRLAMLRYGLQTAPAAELRWFIGQTDALAYFRREVSLQSRQEMIDDTRRWVMRDLRVALQPDHAPDPHDRQFPRAILELIQRFGGSSIELWSDETWEAFTLQALLRICRGGVHGVRGHFEPSAWRSRPRDLLLEATGFDTDLLVHEVLIKFCAGFLDQGISNWPMPHRDDGFFRAFVAMYGQGGGPPDRWRESLPAELQRIKAAGLSPLESIAESLKLLGVPEPEWAPFITSTLLALRGWAGMIHQVETRPDRVAIPAPPGTLVEFLAVRLILERIALAYAAGKHLNFRGPLSEVSDAAHERIPRHEPVSLDQRAFQVFQLAQLLDWKPKHLQSLSKSEWARLVPEIEKFSSMERRRLFSRAYERRYRLRTLDAISVHSAGGLRRSSGLRFQTISCLDDREESFRRHLEELAPDVETFGVAGFFMAPMYYRGVADAHFVPLCPIVMRPQNWVSEEAVDAADGNYARQVKTRRLLGTATHQLHQGTRTFAGGALLTAALGPLASIPLVARVLFPRMVARLRQSARRLVQPPTTTRLQLERTDPTPGPENGHVGYNLDEMANMSERLLRDIGLTVSFARTVIVMGHGSDSVNNPHKAAYDCGACGGWAGGPNARAVAQMLNDRRVREKLRDRGIDIPPETVFVGSLHDTCNDSVIYFDLERMPERHRAEFDEIREIIEQTLDRNAHERCRRFQSAPLSLSFAEARRHVESRAEDLAQPRPELGHQSLTMCIVGRRERTRGLFLDRRAFLASYNPEQDDAESSTLTRVLLPVFPVCSGIILQYHFSRTDSPGWGSGSKLPHNVTSLLGVMDGAASDLRTGLPWQGVEIHEPMRLLIVVETTPERMTKIMERNPSIDQLVRNEWVQLAILNPDSSQIHVYNRGKYEPYRPTTTELPQVTSSVDWYRGWRDHLEFAEIVPSPPV